MLSFSAEPVETHLSLAALGLNPRASYELTEAFTQTRRKGKGADLARFAVKLAPYGVQVWTAAAR